MKRNIILVMVLSLCIMPIMQTQAQTGSKSEKAEGLKLVVTSLEINDTDLKLVYEIRNNSKQDVWICDSVSTAYNCEVYPDEDGKTLIIRKRLDVPTGMVWMVQPEGKYIRLRPGNKKIESLSLTVPVNCVYKYVPVKRIRGTINATRLVIEIGYYIGDLPEVFSNFLRDAEKTDTEKFIRFNMWFGGLTGFNDKNENFSKGNVEVLRQRDEEVFIPYTRQYFGGEKVLSATIDNLHIPYQYKEGLQSHNPPDLTQFTRLEIQYEPSMLEYFYPYQSQRELLNREEMKYLKSEKTVLIEDTKNINDFADDIKQTIRGTGGIVPENSKADVSCYQGSKYITSFTIFDDMYIETEQKQRTKYFKGLQSLRILTPQIQPFELRMLCASNLKNLWHRLQLYDRAKKKREVIKNRFKPNDNEPKKKIDPYMSNILNVKKQEDTNDPHNNAKPLEIRKMLLSFLPNPNDIKLVYPIPSEWCDAMESAHGSIGGMKDDWTKSRMKLHICPSAGEGQNHYAMNPNCKPDSPDDMVLLFETKAGGWNQNGGPELFTFDNHNPKGGCVLLNDGTVKFIRTKEELNQLRWK